MARWLLSRFYYLRGRGHSYWGNRLMSTEEYRQALEDYTRALEFDPAFIQALYDRGRLYWREFADAARAVRDLSRVMELDPERADAHFNRALARQLTNDVAGAIADFEHYLSEGTDPMRREISQRQLALLRADEETTE
ncbi:MAG: tetratricopeptide repeat protein [Anaerolineae bacterium]